MRKLFLIAGPLLLFHFAAPPVFAQSIENNKRRRIQREKTLQKKDFNDNFKCPHATDFYYEIIMGVTTFPQQSDCTDQEEAEIAAFLEESIDEELGVTPGTIATDNKVCSDPINSRRRLLTLSSNETSFQQQQEQKLESTFNRKRSLLRSVVDSPRQGVRILRRRRRSFIYIGGGKCRFCLNDNFDHRVLSPETKGLPTTTTTHEHALSQKLHDDDDGRNLLHLLMKSETALPKVSDILLCKNFLYKLFNEVSDPSSVNWINEKRTRFFDKIENKTKDNIVGPYAAGDSFGVQIDVENVAHEWNNEEEDEEDETKKRLPVKEGTIFFTLFAFDLPTDTTTEVLDDDPFYLFINGMKLDFNQLKSQPNVKRPHQGEIEGTSFAGINWLVLQNSADDFAHGSEPDREYIFSIKAPLIVLMHKNKLDIDFVIKPHAKAKKYAIDDLQVTLTVAECDVTGLDNSPFEDFQSVVESRLFHKLGLDMANEFQSKEGHCLHDKIPVVNVHLVEKTDWKDSNPRCG